MDRQELAEQHRILSEFRSLLSSRAWDRLVEVAKAQQEIRIQAVMLSPLKTQEDAFHQEYMKGEYNGILTLLKLPDTMLEEAKRSIAEAEGSAENSSAKED